MQGIEATIDGLSFGDGRTSRQSLLNIVFGAAVVGSLAGAALTLPGLRFAPRPEAIAVAPQLKPPPMLTAEETARFFGQIVVEPEWAEPNPAPSQLARLEAAPPMSLPSLEAFPRSTETAPAPVAPPPVAAAAPEPPPAPPALEVARLEENAPLPPPRPRDFGPAAREPERRLPPPPPPPAPADSGVFQKMFGWMHPALPSPSAPAVAPRPAAPAAVASIEPERRSEAKAEPSPPPAGASGGRPWFSVFSPRSSPTSSYDGYTAVYDISARTVYLPDGTRLEAHSGLGNRLDDPRYVSERARGATPPHLYELTMREALFHGVQALRLTPVGEGGIYGRAGLLAHPYMLGPNGDSNGCVSVKDYNAFLRAYQNGRIKRLAVVAAL